MGFNITRREVFNNLIRFKDSLLEKPELENGSHSHIRGYPALLNLHTGDIRFAQRIGGPERLLSPGAMGSDGDWEEISLICEDEEECAHFRIAGPRGSSLNPANLDPVVVRILFEMLDILNELASQYHGDENAVLQHLSEIHISPVSASIESMRGWSGKLSRIEAESALLDHLPGSYMFREGEAWTGPVARAFSEANKMTVTLYVLTFVEEEGKIAERLLIQTEWGWTLARDESDLSSPLYQHHPNLDALLYSIRLRKPI